MRPLTAEQVEILESCRTAGDRIVAAARAAGVSQTRVSNWCKATGVPWPRGDYRRALRAGRASGPARDDAVADMEEMFVQMTKSLSPSVASFADRSLAKLRDHDVTTDSQSCEDKTPSGVLIRRSDRGGGHG